jgi:hypothetical protein
MAWASDKVGHAMQAAAALLCRTSVGCSGCNPAASQHLNLFADNSNCKSWQKVLLLLNALLSAVCPRQ